MHIYNKLDHTDLLPYLFHPATTSRITSSLNYDDIDIPVNKDIVLGCRLFIKDKASPTILYFHGNGESVSDCEYIAPLYLENGLNLLVLTYRGYGWSSGIPTVKDMMSDAKTSFIFCQKKLEEQGFTGPLFVMGRSIGSAAAIEVCCHHSEAIKGLLIESGFADTLPLLRNLGFDNSTLQLEEKDGFGNREKIGTIKLPTLILHGSLDTIIPIPQAERLQAFSGARAKKFFIIPGADHNSTILLGGEHYFATIMSFIHEITGETSWRKRRKKYKDRAEK